MNQTQFKYEGKELDLFELANNWKAYWSSMIDDRIRGRVLEVGAGTGSNTMVLTRSARFESWTALEPDSALSQLIPRENESKSVRVITGSIDSLQPSERFDTILYLDVLEHIEDDAQELKKVAKFLNPLGHLIILVPAHQWLFSPFDRSIGHFRRYDKKTLVVAIPTADFSPVFIRYLDSFGVLLSAMNRFVLRRSMPRREDILFWDHQVVPVSKSIDSWLNYSVGKSILGVWRRTES